MVGVFKMVIEGNDILFNIAKEIVIYGEEVEAAKKREVQELKEDMKKDIVLFFSFDIVNSTSYKTVNYYGWAQVINLLFKELREEVCNKIHGSEMWRVLGDEAIFVIKIKDEDDLREYINKIFRIMIQMIFKLKSGQFFDFNNNSNLMKLQNILSLKTSAWLAIVNDVGDISGKNILQKDIDNIFERYQSQDGYEIFEFLGNDIDTGFRIATQTQDGRMVLSYELAYLISQKTESLSFLHIITYKKLKGVCKDKLYPIIWYHDPKAYMEFYKREIFLEDSFTFDACDESDLIKEYYDNRNLNREEKVILEDKMYTDPYYALNRIKQDRGLIEKLERLQKLIKDAVFDQRTYMNRKYIQVHCVAVCFSKNKNEVKILVAKRTKTREKFNGQWEFGCAKIMMGDNITQKLVTEYKKDFNIEISPVLDNLQKIKEPIPIALYHIEHKTNNNESDIGIITLAEINGDYNPDDFKPTNKHEKVKWVIEEDLKGLEREFQECIPDFKQTLQKAFEKIKSL